MIWFYQVKIEISGRGMNIFGINMKFRIENSICPCFKRVGSIKIVRNLKITFGIIESIDAQDNFFFTAKGLGRLFGHLLEPIIGYADGQGAHNRGLVSVLNQQLMLINTRAENVVTALQEVHRIRIGVEGD